MRTLLLCLIFTALAFNARAQVLVQPCPMQQAAALEQAPRLDSSAQHIPQQIAQAADCCDEDDNAGQACNSSIFCSATSASGLPALNFPQVATAPQIANATTPAFLSNQYPPALWRPPQHP